ncbi:MAG: AI-2E family transporter [Gallionella sp.]
MLNRIEYFVQLALILILAAGCYLVLRPFMAAMLLASVLCISTWPLYLRLLRWMKDRKNIAALIMTISMSILIILPLILVAYTLADNVTAYYDLLKQSAVTGLPVPPTWLKGAPVVGNALYNYWSQITSDSGDIYALVNDLLEPARNFLLAGGIQLGRGVMEMSLASFVSFFFYRDGEWLVSFLNRVMNRVVGNSAPNVLAIVNNTVQGVMYGLVGTALAQGLLAAIGFAIAGVPAAFLLGVATALLSPVPTGPPIIWAGAAIWLFYHSTAGWGIFMLLWGFLLVSSVDNFVKPFPISRRSNLPFILILIGVMGGVLAFGFVGVFIGPTMLAVGLNLVQEWAAREDMD